MSRATIERDTTVHGPSGDPDAIGLVDTSQSILMPDVIAQSTLPVGIRLNHLNNDRHDIRHPTEDFWYQFRDHVLIVDTEDEAQWLENLIGRDIIKRDDLPHPVECELCRTQ